MKRLSILVAAPLLALASASHAGNWQLQFTATSTVWGDDAKLYPLTDLTLDIVTADVSTPAPYSSTMGLGYQILSMTGTRNGTAVTGLLSTAGNPNAYPWGTDPTLYVDSPQILSLDGLTYQTTNGDTFSLYGSTYNFGGMPYIQWFEAAPYPTQNPYSSTLLFSGTTTLATAAAVPEPSTWGLLLLGLAVLGGTALSRRRRTGSA